MKKKKLHELTAVDITTYEISEFFFFFLKVHHFVYQFLKIFHLFFLLFNCIVINIFVLPHKRRKNATKMPQLFIQLIVAIVWRFCWQFLINLKNSISVIYFFLFCFIYLLRAWIC